MTEPANPNRPPQHGALRLQFGLTALLGTLMLLCIPFALWGAILRANEADQFWLVILCTAAPLGVMMLVALSVSVGRLLRARRRSRRPTVSEEDTWG